MATTGWYIWADRGGTFTDVLAIAPDGGRHALKLLSDAPDRYDDAVVEAARRLLQLKDAVPVPAGAVAELRLGTTVATNALLERAGARTVLVITHGLGDLPLIRDQARPHLFRLRVQRHQPLCEMVIEAHERVHADGHVAQALDEAALVRALQTARAHGMEAVAIAFAHGAAHPAHEQRAAELARRAGFAHVVCSHEVSPHPGMLARMDTALAQAYVTPRLTRYLAGLGQSLAGARLRMMQSGGGLADAAHYAGKDSLLSGPAGGVIGAVRVCEAAGLTRIVGFDMGGTSTDVFHYAGQLERRDHGEVAGVRVRAPLLDIHTVAAGGGSRLDFDGARLRVGPASAGADPGPACYRRGGPLALTDANVLLNRVLPAHFPPVFGPRGDQPLDVEAVHRGFATLAEDTARVTGQPQDPLHLAAGALRIAVDNMANAIRRITVQRGIDISGHALCCFGGAGPQHACAVADALDVQRVFVPWQAGLLSALGVGLSPLRAAQERAVDAPLDRDLARRLPELARQAADQAREALAAQGVAQPSQVLVHAVLRYDAAETALPVPLEDDAGALRAAFEKAHRELFGFADPDRRVIVASVTAEALGGAAEMPAQPPARKAAARPVDHVDMYVTDTPDAPGTLRSVPVYRRDDLADAQGVDGPALLLEPHSTIVVEAGWRAVRQAGGLMMERTHKLPVHRGQGTAVDPVRLEIFHNRFMVIAEQMGDALQRTAVSVNVRERMDFSCAVFDGRGRLVANAPHIPVHLGSMGVCVQRVLALRGDELAPGDGWLLNDPYHGGTHLPDLTVVAPVFDVEGRTLRYFVAARAHHADIGGCTPGSMPADSHGIEDEGVLLACHRLTGGGRFFETELRAALSAGAWPARSPDQNVADLKAQIAAVSRGVHALQQLDAEQGAEVVAAYMQHVQDNAAAAVRRLLPKLPAGRHRVELDNGLVIQVALQPDVDAGRLRVDFSGTSAQHDGNFNAPAAIARAALMYALRCLLDQDIPLNDGCLEPVDLIIPQGCLLNPRPPAAVVAGNVETSQCVVDALLAAAGCLAESQGTMNNLSFGHAGGQYYETVCGGGGAGPDFDGAAAVHVHMTNSRITDVEILEARHPVRVDRFGVRQGSGGAGRHRGGDGCVRTLCFLAPMTTSLLGNRRRVPAQGLHGGRPGAAGRNTLLRAGDGEQILPGCVSLELEAGDRLIVETPAGGGFGDGE